MLESEIFNNSQIYLAEELRTKGYTKLGRVSQSKLQSIQKETKKLTKDVKNWESAGQLFALINTTPKLKKHSNEIVSSYLLPFLEDKFNDSKVDLFPVSHVVKPFGKESIFHCHQDSVIVDEPNDFSLNIWMPLTNVSRLNGCLWVLPGSHVFPYYTRVFGNNPFLEETIKKELWRRMKPVHLKAGEVFVFHRSLLHGSSRNYLPCIRMALEGVVVPKTAQFVQYYYDSTTKPGEVNKFKVEKEHFLNENPEKALKSRQYPYTKTSMKSNREVRKNLYDYLQQFDWQVRKLE